jgi:hypothetical protein
MKISHGFTILGNIQEIETANSDISGKKILQKKISMKLYSEMFI